MSKIAVIIATKNRSNFLFKALTSVAAQTKKPERVVVIVDSEDDNEPTTRQVVNSMCHSLKRLELIKNERTYNLSGAINTGISHLLKTGEYPESTYIAILDDDDEWDREYIESCSALAEKNRLDWVISGIIRHETKDDKGKKLSIPRSLSTRDFLVSNPHVQGSNLFVRFSTLLNAGCFDEFLDSTTDRDLCIRLLDLGNVKYGFLRKHLVHHRAIPDIERLSTPGSRRKVNGLRSFYWKHVPRMSHQDKEMFKSRAGSLFNCKICEFRWEPKSPPSIKTIGKKEMFSPKFPIVVGVISTRLDSTRNLLHDLTWLSYDSGLISKVVIVDNTSSTIQLKNLINDPLFSNLNIVLKESDDVNNDCKNGLFGAYLLDEKRRKGIAAGRTVLHHCVYNEAKSIPGSVVWILDDDIRLDYLLPEGSVSKITMDELQEAIAEMKHRGVSIAIGQITGDPPLPSLSLIRTQLLDIFYNIKRFENADSRKVIQNLADWNRMLIDMYPEYYYDYSELHSAHLEVPFWYSDRNRQSESDDSLKNLLDEVSRICSGKDVFRPIVTSAGDQAQKSKRVMDRGGNTMVLNIECLRYFPNPSPNFGHINARRGDTFWCILNSRIGGYRIERFPIAVRQERAIESGEAFSIHTLHSDFYGSSFIRAIDEFYAKKIEEQGNLPRRVRLTLMQDEIDEIVNRFDHYLNKRLAQFIINSYRIRGLILSISASLNSRSLRCAEDIESFQYFLSSLDNIFAIKNVNQFIREARECPRNELREFLHNLKEYVRTYKKTLTCDLTQAHIEHAKASIINRIGESNLRYLGHGWEGIVFTDEKRAYKYFNAGKANFQEGQLEFIQERILGNKTLKHMVELEEVKIEEGELIFVMRYENGSKYEGGHLSGILELIRECRDSGIAITNFHPDNLLVTEGHVKFTDIGNSIVPLNEREYIEMCKRAYLTYRWHFRKDLSHVMERALYDNNIPELFGFEEFLKSLNIKTTGELLYQQIIDLVNEGELCNILDYGCGKGTTGEKLVEMGYDVTGFDLDLHILEQNIARNGKVKYLDHEGLEKLIRNGKKFQKIICSLVLCTVEDDNEFNIALSNMRKLIYDGGEVILAFCNPFYSFVQESESHIKIDIENDKKYHNKITYNKKIKENSRIRKEVHRPFSYYKRSFHMHGFEIKDLIEVRTTDILNLCPSSDFMIVRLQPLEVPDEIRVSLLINACAMEWQTIDFQIKHIINQLVGPQSFLEKVVVAEDYEGPFLRQYAEPNLDEFKRKLNDLVEGGVIDRVIWAPGDPDSVEKTLKKWFGLSSTKTHCLLGQHIYSTLYGMDHCDGKYILQLDSDCLVVRQDRNHDYLSDMINIFERDPKALSVSFNIPDQENKEYTQGDGRKKWRIEVRFSLIDKDRLESALPLPNECTPDGTLRYPWYRSLDMHLSKTEWQSYRGGDRRTSFIHVPNDYKPDIIQWYNIMKSVERGHIPDMQYGNVDLKGTLNDWLEQRQETFVFIVRGKDVPTSKLRRCIDSIIRQSMENWGVVIIDAASTNPMPEYIEEVLFRQLKKGRVTLFKNYSALSSMENNKIAISKLCSNSGSVILTLDADDSLIGRDVLRLISGAYDSEADLTVGSMLRTDKHKEYPVDFINPRLSRGGNVWQHLRTFRKDLFDKIPEEYLKVGGKWVQHTEDWAFMLPMVEMASHPVHITEFLYFYEPSGDKSQEAKIQREELIGKLVNKHPCIRREMLKHGA